MEQIRPTLLSFRRTMAGADLLTTCRNHLRDEGDDLFALLQRVAGREGARRLVRLQADLGSAMRWEPSFGRRLKQINGLLMLEHLHDDWPESVPEPECLDPASDLAAECCWHADRLQDLIDRAASIHMGAAP